MGVSTRESHIHGKARPCERRNGAGVLNARQGGPTGSSDRKSKTLQRNKRNSIWEEDIKKGSDRKTCHRLRKARLWGVSEMFVES